MTGRALHRYAMIGPGDRVAVGLSGGKDSLTLAWLLKERLARVPIDYELFAIYVDPGFQGSAGEVLKRFCCDLGVPLTIITTDHGPHAHSAANRENPCFLCARLRRKCLFETADRLGCNKIALGHNKDDLIETLFLNICYAGEISTMVPAQTFFKGHFTMIRPLAYVDEAVIARFAREAELPVCNNPCPSANSSKRREIKELLARLYRTNRKIKGNIFHSLSHVKTDYLLPSIQRQDPVSK